MEEQVSICQNFSTAHGCLLTLRGCSFLPTRLNIKRLAAGLAVVSEDEFQRIVSDLEDGASISGSDSECDDDDNDGDDEEFRGDEHLLRSATLLRLLDTAALKGLWLVYMSS